jgi:hypothetical protein
MLGPTLLLYVWPNPFAICWAKPFCYLLGPTLLQFVGPSPFAICYFEINLFLLYIYMYIWAIKYDKINAKYAKYNYFDTLNLFNNEVSCNVPFSISYILWGHNFNNKQEKIIRKDQTSLDIRTLSHRVFELFLMNLKNYCKDTIAPHT